MPFLTAIQQRFRYGSVLTMAELLNSEVVTREESRAGWLQIAGFLPHHDNAVELADSEVQVRINYILDLSPGYEQVYASYSRDRKLNLRRAKAANWTLIESTNIEPLLTLFRENHADTIHGGVADWAYDLFRKLNDAMNHRSLSLIRYAVYEGTIEAGALFVREGNRIIYLFNAASKTGRQKNARTLLIDQVIRAYAGQNVMFDFESPQKPSIANFYRSFGATDEVFQAVRWNRFTVLERAFLRIRRLLLTKSDKGNT
ncbi:hypothetical protein GCM10028825_42090 [Spirosoma agri]